MAGGLWSGLGKLLDAGTAYLQHVNLANQLLADRSGQAPRQYVAYVRDLTDAGFAGLKVTLSMLLSQEQDPVRKAGLQRLLESADAARCGRLVPQAANPELAAAEGASFDDDLARVGRWYDELDGPARRQALVEHLSQLSPAGFRAFSAHVQQMIRNCEGRIAQHEQAQDQAWGSSFEDRMAYGMARLQTGQRDPAWQRQMNLLQDVKAFFEAVLAAAQDLWAERQRPPSPPTRSQAMNAHTGPQSTPTKASAVAPESVLAGVRELMRTGQYPGGADKMKADVAALVLAGQADEVMEALNAMGANDVGNKTLRIEDYYVDGPEPYRQRWPIQFPLPMPFDELPRNVQFSVLFGEWSRREMEGSYALMEGRSDDARAAYQECLERARQIDVKELIARSHEGLARVASKINDRAQERQHLKAAIDARGAA